MYDKKQYFQVSVIPYRLAGDEVEFCLITSTKTKTWGFPKGTIKKEQTPLETAQQSALQEAGVVGEIAEEPVGSFKYLKWEELQEVLVLMMRVSTYQDEWPDADRRERQWASVDHAVELLSKAGLKKLVKEAHDRIQTG